MVARERETAMPEFGSASIIYTLFPLTPTLSLGERENHRQAADASTRRQCCASRMAVPCLKPAQRFRNCKDELCIFVLLKSLSVPSKAHYENGAAPKGRPTDIVPHLIQLR